ncbi:TPA: hypothetical protein ACQOJI_001783, partial [Streptococcus pyogenes]
SCQRFFWQDFWQKTKSFYQFLQIAISSKRLVNRDFALKLLSASYLRVTIAQPVKCAVSRGLSSYI